jgi:D-lyxose ketol-isomerase
MPVLVAVTAQPVGSSSDADADDTSTYDVDILNTSQQLLAITVIDFNARKRTTASTQVLITPNGQTQIRVASGLPLEPGDEITLRSNGFRDVTQAVP